MYVRYASKKGTALIITLVVIFIFIGYSFVLTANSLVESRDTKLSIASMSALYIAESGLDTYLVRLQADPENAIMAPLSSVSHPGVGEDWQGITLPDGVHYFISPRVYIPREQLAVSGVVVPDLSTEDALYALPHAEDGTGISASDTNAANRRLYQRSAGSFFIRIAYFRPTPGADGTIGTADDDFAPWAGDNDSSGIAFDPKTFAIQISAVAHLNPRAEVIVNQLEGFLDLDGDGAFGPSDEVVEGNTTFGRQSVDYRRVTYEAVRIVEGSLQNNSEPDVTKVIGGAIVNLGVDENGDPGGDIVFDNPGSNTLIKGSVLSNTKTKIKPSTIINTNSGFNSSLKNSANYLDSNGFPIFRFGWVPSMLETTDSNGDPIVWNDMDIVNPVDGSQLFKSPYSVSGGDVLDSSSPPKVVPSDYTDILKSNLAGTSDELDKGMVTPGSDSQLFNINQYVAVAAGTQVIDPVASTTTTVAGKYYNAAGAEITTFAGGSPPGRTATGDIDWSAEASAVSFHGPGGWVFKNQGAFINKMKTEGELNGVVVINYVSEQDISTTDLLSATNPQGAINIRGTLVFRFNNTFGPGDKIKIAARLYINPAEFPTYPLTLGVDGGTLEEQRLFDLRGTMIPPNDPMFFNYDGSAPSGYPDTQAKKDVFYDASYGVAGVPTVFPERIDISAYDDPSKPPGTKFKNLGENSALPDYPALLFNQSTVDIHGNANICGAVFGPAFGEIENKGEGITPLWHYFVGAIIIGDGLKVKNNASGNLFSSTIPAIGEHWKASVFIYAPTHINNLAIEEKFIPGKLGAWKFVSTSIRR